MALVALPFKADASITVTKTNSTGASVNGSSVDQSINFSVADFGGLANIAKVTVSITFSKLNLLLVDRPEFREIGFIFAGAGNSEILVRDRDHVDGASFKRGKKGASFDGTITFDQAAADVVNDDRDQIQAGTFRPDNGDLGGFVGLDAVGDWTLTITDTNGGFLNPALTVDSWSVSITALTSVPEPTALGMWGGLAMFAGVIVFYRPRRRAIASLVG